jgi:hypothetical protein
MRRLSLLLPQEMLPEGCYEVHQQEQRRRGEPAAPSTNIDVITPVLGRIPTMLRLITEYPIGSKR